MSLIDAVLRWLHRNPDFQPVSITTAASDLKKPADLMVERAPTLRHRPPPDEFEQRLSIARKFDAAVRAERNRVLGRAGEERVLANERAILTGLGHTDLANSVRWVSEEDGDGDGDGDDIASFYPEGRPRLIEVKTTNGWKRTPFHITRNELAVAEDRPHEWCLLRLWNFARQPRAFELRPPLNAHVTLIATSYVARFH